jgi:hypothetical protein
VSAAAIRALPHGRARLTMQSEGASMIRYVLGTLAFLIATSACAAESEREFAQGMLEKLQAAVPDGEFRIASDDPLAIEMKQDGKWGDAVINTHRIYGYCRNATAEDCEAAALEFAASINARPPEPKVTDLRLIVRDQEYMDYLLRAGPDEENQPVFRSIGEGLVAIVAFDSPQTIALAMRPKLSELGIEEDEAWRVASAQTKAVLPELPPAARFAEGAIAFQDYEFLPSLMADTEAWRAISAEAGPNLFATAVSDYFVFVGVMPDGPELNRFKQTVREDCEAQQRCISPNVYRFRDGRWVIAN